MWNEDCTGVHALVPTKVHTMWLDLIGVVLERCWQMGFPPSPPGEVGAMGFEQSCADVGASSKDLDADRQQAC